MTESSRFWSGTVAGGASGDAGPYTMNQMAAVFAMLMGQRTGVLSGLAVKESSPAAKSVTVEVGNAIIEGLFYETDAEVETTLSDNGSGNPRIDTIVLACDWSGANAQTIRVAVVEGGPAASPVAPSLTQNAGVLWQEPLATATSANGFSSITAADITRRRTWARLDHPGKLEATPLSESNIPAGWLLCDGSAISRTTYRDLFDAIGTDFGVGDGSTTFNVPDLRGRTIIGKDNMGGASANVITDSNADILGGTMGAETHTLTEDEMPSHNHTVSFNDQSYGGGTTIYPAGAQNASIWGSSSDRMADAGSDAPHNNLPPSMALNVMIRT